MNAYEKVTQIVLDTIDKEGLLPWQRPWVGEFAAWSHATGRDYSLLNCLLCGRSGEFGTFKQWKAAGGTIRKGAKSRLICFYTMVEKADDKHPEEEKETFPMLRYYNVFHSNDVEGDVKLKRHQEESAEFQHDRHEEADHCISEYVGRAGILLQQEPSVVGACYYPADNMVQVPPLEKFREQPEYYSTMFHELVHSTQSAMHRDANHRFGSRKYAAEELVAEMGAAFLCYHFGLLPVTIDNSAAYLKSWRDRIANDSRLIVTAATAAEKAVKFIISGELPPERAKSSSTCLTTPRKG